jgi:hypothetical protein
MINDNHLPVPLVDMVLAHSGNHPRKFDMRIQCGRFGFATRPRNSGQSNIGNVLNLTYQYKRALTMELFAKKIVGRKFESQDSYSDDDVSAISDSDSDINR